MRIDSLPAMLAAMFAAAGVTACLLVASIVVRGRWTAGRKAAISLYCAFTSAALIWKSPLGRYLDQVLPALSKTMLILGGGTPGAIWLLVVALFEDRRLSRLDLLPAALSIAIFAPAALGAHGGGWIFRGWVAWSVVLMVHAVTILVRSWPGDLVEARRGLRLRLAGLMAMGCVLFVLMLVQLAVGRLLHSPDWAPLALNGLLVLAIMTAAVLMLDARGDLFEPVRRRSIDNGDAELLSRLRMLMASEEPWRQESFSLGDLTRRLGAPEYRLRRLIHDQLGHRNFAEFVNSHRLDAARQLLTNADRTTIAEAAFAVGFASLSPFNRAFKQRTGLTPTAWRKQMLSENSN